MKSCPNCGASLPSEDSRFCFSCGADVTPAKAGDAPVEPPAASGPEASAPGQAAAPGFTEPAAPPVSKPAFSTAATPAPGQPAAPSADGSSLFTPAFASESGTAPLNFSAARGELPTGKEAEELLKRALADTGSILLSGGQPVASEPLFPAPDSAAAPKPATGQPLDLFAMEDSPAAEPAGEPAGALFAGTEGTSDAPAEPASPLDEAEESPFDHFAEEDQPEDLFAQPDTTEAEAADELAAGATAEFTLPGDDEPMNGDAPMNGDSMPGGEGEPRQVFPTRQQDLQQTIPYESQQNIENLFEENEPTQRYPQQGQMRQRAGDEAARQAEGRPREDRAAMVANIAQAAGADEDDRARRSRPMADGRGASRPGEARRRPAEADWPPPRKKRNTGKIVRNVLLIILLFLVATFLATVGLLYFRNRPAATIESFTAAITAKDYSALADMASLSDAPSTTEGWEAFCAAFADEEAMTALKTQLAAKPSSEDDTSGLTYEAVTLEGESLLLFVKKYYVRVTGIELLAPGAAEGTQLTIMGGEHSGTPTADGVLYGKFMPGAYSCQLTPPGGAAEGAIEVTAFSVSAPNPLEAGAATAETASVTVENCRTDDATLYVNDNEVSEKPSGGVVQLADVPLGAEIKIIANEDGQRTQSAVFFNDLNVTTLRFENYTPVEGDESGDAAQIAANATTEEINQVLATFYASYLECINAQSINGIQLSTEKNNQALQGRITGADNAANTFSYVSAAANASSITTGEENGVPSIKLNGTFEYSYAPRDDAGNVQRGSNRQSVHLLYVGDQWVVDGFVFVDEADYNNNVVAAF